MTEVLVTLTGFGELGGGGAHVLVGAAPGLARLPAATEATTEQPEEGPSPISPELKELVWGGGAFLPDRPSRITCRISAVVPLKVRRR